MMRNLIVYSFIFILALLSNSCSTNKTLQNNSEDEYVSEVLDTLEITDTETKFLAPQSEEFRATKPITYDILHMDLTVSFDFAKQEVFGKAGLDIKPYFYPIDQITLDADGFDIHSVLVNGIEIKNFTYNGEELTIPLGKTYKKDEKFKVFVDYTAKPNETSLSDASNAIQSDKGLFFIDPLETNPDSPTQIWSQGETENNSKWFPTFDKPTERFTQSITLQVPEKYMTLSNGKLIESKNLGNGLRADRWVQDKPHTPYLVMIAVGDWAVSQETWNGIPLQYIVDHEYAADAKRIFNHTPEMLTFFSKTINYPYPWDKYAQIVVKEYVSGAMENTTAVVFGDFIQKHENELIDNDNDYIVSHEMMHHWFGDLVTCEDWSNLTLNEGFANYAEYLWAEYKYGRDKADHHRMEELNGYLSQVYSGGAHPLIDYHYVNKEKMFDAHSYNKGGLILHQLRYYLGDEAFFAGLNHYLTKNAYSSVEADELRLAFEDVSGLDLHWFFDQWFFGVGHPNLDINYAYDDVSKSVTIDVSQESTSDDFSKPFILPFDIALYYEGAPTQWYKGTVKKLRDTILIKNVSTKPDVINLDGNNVLLGLFQENKTQMEYQKQFQLSPLVFDKISALSRLDEDHIEAVINDGLNADYYFVRLSTLHSIPETKLGNFIEKLQSLALSDPNTEVRASAFQLLLSIEDFDPTTLAETVMKTEKSYQMLYLASYVLKEIKPESLAAYIPALQKDSSDNMVLILAGMMTEDTPQNLQFFNQHSLSIPSDKMNEFFALYNEYLAGKSLPTLTTAGNNLLSLVSNPSQNQFRKYYSMYILSQILQQVESMGNVSEAIAMGSDLNQRIEHLIQTEPNEKLVDAFRSIFPKK